MNIILYCVYTTGSVLCGIEIDTCQKDSEVISLTLIIVPLLSGCLHVLLLGFGTVRAKAVRKIRNIQ